MNTQQTSGISNSGFHPGVDGPVIKPFNTTNNLEFGKYSPDRGGRSERIDNIVIWFINAILRHGCCDERTKWIRNDIREGYGGTLLSGESRNGDYRAHGDAIGGHGLGLKRCGSERIAGCRSNYQTVLELAKAMVEGNTIMIQHCGAKHDNNCRSEVLERAVQIVLAESM